MAYDAVDFRMYSIFYIAYPFPLNLYALVSTPFGPPYTVLYAQCVPVRYAALIIAPYAPLMVVFVQYWSTRFIRTRRSISEHVQLRREEAC